MKKFVLLPAIILITFTVRGQIDTLQRIDALFSLWNNATPGAAVAIKRGDKIIYHKAYGLADLEHRVPNTTETIFESGSVAKQFTATSILMLVDQGKLMLTDDVRKYIPELPVYNKAITIQHLLNHTSGLKDWGSIGGLAGWPRTTRIYTQDLALQIICKQKSLNFTPGDQYSYSNSNYSLLVTIVERNSKKSLQQFTDSVFFTPLGMTSTKWRNNFREVVPNRAIAYSMSNGNYQQLMPFEHVHGHGGLLTTTGDLLKWNALLKTHQIVGDRVAALRIQKGKLNNGEEISYACGLVNGSANGFKEISHSGATAGYRAWLGYYPQKDLSIVILSNSASYRDVSHAIAEIFLGKEIVKEKPEPVKFISLTEAQKKNWAGFYKRSDNMEVISLEYKDNQILSNGHVGQATHPDTLYVDRSWWIRKTPTEIQLKNTGGLNTYSKVSPAESGSDKLQMFKGTYVSEEADATYAITTDHEGVWLQIAPWPKQKLEPLYKDGFRDENYVFYEFKRDKNNKITSLMVTTSRAINVPFVKK